MIGINNEAGLIQRSAIVEFRFGEHVIQGHEGESLAAALQRSGILGLRTGPDDSGPRGAFCFMGLCQECLVRIDGKTLEACRARIAPGLVVERLEVAAAGKKL